jgi:Protein of unknown function (DUF433)
VKPKKKKPAKRATSAAIPANDSSARVREEPSNGVADYHGVITIEPDKRGGRACIRGMRITVGDVLGWLAAIHRREPARSGRPVSASRSRQAC